MSFNSTSKAIEQEKDIKSNGNVFQRFVECVIGFKDYSEELFLLNETGSPHYVQWVDDLKSLDVNKRGREVRYNPRFKDEGTNVNFMTLHARYYHHDIKHHLHLQFLLILLLDNLGPIAVFLFFKRFKALSTPLLLNPIRFTNDSS